jgi:lipopolysaccharide transport system permease protein
LAKIHIKPNRSWFGIDWREIAEYRDLLRLLVIRDLTAVYKQSILGPLWFVIQPLAPTLVFTVVFGNIAKISTDGMPPFLFYMSGMVLWSYFQACMNNVAESLSSNSSMFAKVYFPRLIVPLAAVIKNLAQLGLSFATFLAFYAYYLVRGNTAVHPTIWIVAFPLLVLQCMAAGLGVGLWLSALTVKYRDLRYALPFLTQVWMYATPIAYPASLVSEKWRWFVVLNPMAGVIEFNRHAFLGSGSIRLDVLIGGGVTSIFLLVSGLVLFNKVQRTFVDTI